MGILVRALLTLVVAILVAAPARAEQPARTAPAHGLRIDRTGAQPPADDLPIFDTHIHYSEDAWSVYSEDAALAILDQAGVYRALVSSTPDDGTLRLYQRAPERIVPILRPYVTRADMSSWTRDLAILEHVQQRLKQGIYRGIGEFHLGVGEANSPVPREFARLSAEQDLFLHAHADAAALAELMLTRPDIKVLWAHAGMSASPATVGRLLDLHPNLWVELALRADVAPGGRLNSSWDALFQRHPDRFMIGTDTWITPQWTRLPRLMADVRTWLRQLPRDLAEQIAFRNAERLFGTR